MQKLSTLHEKAEHVTVRAKHVGVRAKHVNEPNERAKSDS